MHLVVALDADAVGIEDQHRVAHAVGDACGQRDGTGKNPDTVALGSGRQPVLHRPAAEFLAHPQAVGIGGADDGKVFGQNDEFGALVHGLVDQPAGHLQVVGDIRPGNHLDPRHAAILLAHCLSPSTAAGAVSTVALPMFSTFGSDHVPVT